MKATPAPHISPRPDAAGAMRLLALVGRSAPPHRPVGELLRRWYATSGTDLLFDEWADPAAERLAGAFDRGADLAAVEQAVTAFAQARAGAAHGVDAVTADLVALVRLARPTGLGTWADAVDPLGLLARALSAWAAEHAATRSCTGCVDAATGLVTADFLRERVRELHAQCHALAIAPQVAFAALVVQFAPQSGAAVDRMVVRVAVGRLLSRRFGRGETVATVGASRMVVVMPAYGVDRAAADVAVDVGALDGADIAISQCAFTADAVTTFRSLAGTATGP
jgi:hypothetical protein